MNTAELMISCLENEGARFCFGLPGEENLEFLNALSQSKIKTIITRDERGAAFMANAYGRFTLEPGVCFSTLGPGATNLVTGIADAQLDFAPVVAITAQASSLRRHKESHQYIDILSMLRAITKWNVRIDRPEITPESVRKAFKLAVSEKPGATHIELPEDIAVMDVEGNPLNIKKTNKTISSIKTIKKAVEIIRDSNMPIIIAGHGVIRSRASQNLRTFAEKSGIPVVTTFMGMGAIEGDHKLFVSNIGLQSRDFIQCGIDRADLIIAVGYDTVEFSPKWWDGTKKLIHIDNNPSEVDTNYSAFEVLGDISENLNQIISYVDFTKDYSYCLRLKDDIQNDIEELLGFKCKNGINPLAVINTIRDNTKRDDILISDVGAHKIWIGRCYKAYEPNSVLISNGFAAMGIALPSAITAKLLYPQKNVVCAVGDGGFLMSIGEIETAKRLNLKFTIVIFNDNGYGLIRWKQQNRYKKDFFVDLTNPDFLKIAQAFGCDGYIVDTEEDLRSAFKTSLNSNNISIIDCRVDYSINKILTERLGKIVCRI
ncbi:MAG: acetolactate synthase large subunit [Thermodesulfovibrionales bacterium]|nr:acetolactate synthase large subunit [Thermodesulfovibrionales bacterium]